MSEATWQRLDGPVTFTVPVKAAILLSALLAANVGVLALSLMSGTYALSMSEVFSTLFGFSPSETATTVVWELRFPRALAAALTGVLFALSGAVLQNVTRNPLADPSLVGVSQGAGFAVVLAIVVFPETGLGWRPLLAFCGALAVAALIQWIAMQRSGGATMRFILTGIGVAAFISAGTNTLLTYGDIDRALAALGWLAGSVHASGWPEVTFLLIATGALTPVLFWASRPLAALRFGPDVAAGLGVAVRKDRFILITLSVALAAFAVAAVGPLGFIGLVAPHIARRLARAGVGLNLALTAAIGALMVGLADLAGRALFAPVQIPAGLVTAVIGVPIFVWLILRSQARSTL